MDSGLATEAVTGLAQAETSSGDSSGQAEPGGEAKGGGMRERQTGVESSSCRGATRRGEAGGVCGRAVSAEGSHRHSAITHRQSRQSRGRGAMSATFQHGALVFMAINFASPK